MVLLTSLVFQINISSSIVRIQVDHHSKGESLYYRKKSEHIDKGHIARRKAVLKAAQRQHPGDTFAWVGGVLFFTNALIGFWPVKGVPKIPKPGHEAKGLAAIEQPNPRRQREHFRHSAPSSHAALHRPVFRSIW